MRFLSYVIFAFVMTFYNTARAATSDHTNTLLQLFGNACWQNLGVYRAINESMTEQKMPEISESEAKKYLKSRKGKVWSIVKPQGEYFVAALEGNECAVFSSKADQDEISVRLNEMMLNTSKQGFFKMQDRQEQQQYYADYSTIRQSFLFNNKDLSILIRTQTSNSPNSNRQAMISFTPLMLH